MAESLLLRGICAEDSDAARAHVWMFDHASVYGEINRRFRRLAAEMPSDALEHARRDNLDWPMAALDWRAAKLARVLDHFDLRFTDHPSEPELLDVCLKAEAKAVTLLRRLEGEPRRKGGKEAFNGHTIADLSGFVLRRMFAEVEAELAKKSPAERAAFALDLSNRLDALPDDVKERIRRQAGIADFSSEALMRTGAIAAVGSVIAGSINVAGFAAYTTLTSTLAGMASLFGMHLSFHTFIFATSALAFAANPVVVGGAMVLGGGLLTRRANQKIRDCLIPVMAATATASGVKADGPSGAVADMAACFDRHAQSRQGVNPRSRRRIEASYPCLPQDMK